MSVIKIEQLTKNFGHFTAVDNISMRVEEGEVFGFIGPNGAGKTTSMRVLLGMYKPTSGVAEIFGKHCWRDAVDIHKRIAYVPGDVNLWPNLTGLEVIDLLCRLNGVKNEKRRDQFIQRFDLDISKKCKKYSKGNRQKVALVAAMTLDADLYLFDEPTSGLDPLMEEVFQECVAEEKKKGKTVFLSSHILSEVESLCDRIAIIKKGRVIESGTLDTLRHLTRSNVRLTLSSLIDDNLLKMEGVHNLNAEDGVYTFQVDNAMMGSMMREIGKLNVNHIEITPLSLEELFLHYYSEA